MAYLLSLATAGVVGFIHALELDHMVAVSAFVARRPTFRAAIRFGLRWGIGHSAAVLAAGLLLLATGLRWDARYDRVGEAVVGVMLIAIGLWSLRSTPNLHLHLPAQHGDHAHLHLHPQGAEAHRHGHPAAGRGPAPDRPAGPPAPPPPHRHGVTLVGLLHGLAGTSAVVALVPVTLADRLIPGVGYLVAFGVGVTGAMVLFAAVTAAAVRQASDRSLAWGRKAASGAGWASVGLGAWWLVRAAQ